MIKIRSAAGMFLFYIMLGGNLAWGQDAPCPQGDPNSLVGKRMVINLATNDVNRAVLAFNFALANRGCGADVIVFLSDKGTIFSTDATPRVRDSQGLSVPTRIERLLASGGRVLLCPPCLTENYGLDPTKPDLLIDGVELFNPGLLNVFYTDSSAGITDTSVISW